MTEQANAAESLNNTEHPHNLELSDYQNKHNNNNNNNNNTKIKGISGSTLKIIALISMFLDHFGATVVRQGLKGSTAFLLQNLTSNPRLALYYSLRIIGRLAFPIFIFLLVEGYTHTRNKWIYLHRMLIFSLISEIPFDMALSLRLWDVRNHHFLEFTHQNVYFTLTLGLFAIILYDIIENYEIKAELKLYKDVAAFIPVIICGILAQMIRCDYGCSGVIAIFFAFFFRRNKFISIGSACSMLSLSSLWELPTFLDVLLVKFYNGKKGLGLKYIFYIFYPAHLLILALICQYLY